MIVKLNTKPKADAKANLQAIIDGEDWRSFTNGELAAVNRIVQMKHIPDLVQQRTDGFKRLLARYRYSASAKRNGNPLLCLSVNRKTGDSFDVRTTGCIYDCAYCYLNDPHLKAQIEERGIELPMDWLTPTRERLFRQYLRDRKEIVRNHPLRFFSLGDCPDEYVPMVQRFLLLCQAEDTETIVVTKNESALRQLYPLATRCLYSVDRGIYGSPTSIERYATLRVEMPNLRMFGMVVDFDELRWFQERIEDFGIDNYQLVAYHGQLNATEKSGDPPVQSSLGQEMKPMLLNVITKQIGGKAVGCCAINRCAGCPFRCGVRPDAPTRFKAGG